MQGLSLSLIGGSCPPLIVGDIKMSVDGEEDLLQEADPLSFLLLRLFKNGFHLLHVARRVGRHVLQHLLILLPALQAAHKNSFTLNTRSLRKYVCSVSLMEDYNV